MSIYKYEVLNAVVKLGSLTKAAQALNLTQSGVSHAISSLESELGVALLLRDRSGVRLTSSGSHLLPHIREVLTRNELIKQEASALRGLEAGTVTIGTFTSVSVQWLSHIIKRFHSQHPSIDVRLMEGRYKDIRTWLADGDVDFGFLSSRTAANFDFIPLKDDKIVCLIPDNHALASHTQISFAQLKNETLITSNLGKTQDFKEFYEKLGPQNIKFETTGPETVVAMVGNGLGISFLPELAIYQPTPEIRVVNLAEHYCRTLGIAVPSMSSLSPAVEKFISITKGWLSEHNMLDY